MFRKFWICLLVLMLCVGVYGQKSKRTQTQKAVPTFSTEHMNSQHREILRNWLTGKPGWRPAVENDAYVGQTKEGREFYKGEIQSMSNHPFYVAADLNKDGKQDFAVMLVKKVGKKNKFAVAIFNSTYGKQKLNPAFYTESVSDGDLLFWMDGNLLLSPPASDSGNIIAPRGNTYVLR
jgi:hypothetical protein